MRVFAMSRGRSARSVSSSLVVTFLAAMFVVLTQASPAHAVPTITLAKTATSNVLVGGRIGFELAATNPTGPTAADEFNLSFRDELPLGVTYVAGSTSPASLGEPTIRTAGNGRQTLIWSNVADLPIGQTTRLAFIANASSATYPVGSTVPNTATAYANTDPRVLPRFDSAGVYTSGATEQATSGAASTGISALDVTKSEPSPERELLRGVHDQSTVYTITTRNNGAFATNGVTVVDLLPAGLEFLGCGTTDNSSAPEYTGAASLASVPDVTTSCPTPTSVTTVTNPPGRPAGIYTRVEWTLGNLAPGAENIVRYRAGIPQRANTATFPSGTPTGLGQVANLDNNTGPSTRETAAEQALTNAVTASGVYQGPVAPGASTSVSDTDTVTVTAEDLALVKSVNPGAFTGGGVATYTLTLRTGEYVDATNIVLTDVLPDGLCPLSTTTNYAPGAPAECGPVPGSNPTGASYDTVTVNDDGSYRIVFTPVPAAHNTTTTVTFRARMRASFGGGGQDPTVSGDGFTNTVSLTGTTTVRPQVQGPGDTGPTTVDDTSSASLSSDGPSIDKRIQPDVPANRPYSCSTSSSAYVDNLTANDPQLTFDEGDRVCFLVRVDFSDVNSTKNVQVADFLPPGMVYEIGSAQLTPNNTVDANIVQAVNPVRWVVGTPRAGGRFVAPGGVFEAVLSATIGAPAPGPAPDITANLFKMRYENTGGSVSSLRDQLDLSVAPPPPVGIAKTAARISPNPATIPNNGNVAGGQVVQYTVRVTNNGSTANRNNLDVIGPDVWDVLPAGITCSMVGTISDSGICYDPASADYPTPRTGLTTRSIIRWDLASTITIVAGANRALTYRVTWPSTFSVSRTFTNNAAVSTYQTSTNTGGVSNHAPASNIGAGVTDTDVPAAEATFTVVTPNASVTKTAVTDVTEGGNTNAQGAIGETLTYTYYVNVPAGTSVHNGSLTDPMPTGIVLTGTAATATYFPDASTTTTAALPGGFSLDPATGALTFPTTWTNDTTTVQRFQVSIQARVQNAVSSQHGTGRTNTATFRSSQTPGGTAVTARTGTATVTVVEPSPTLTKVNNDADGRVTAGQNILYTLTADNVAGRPPLHDAFIVDCIPAGLDLVAGSPTPAARDITAGTGTGAGSNGCAVGTTRIEWSLNDLVAGSNRVITYRVIVTDVAGGSAQYQNTAQLSGSSMDDNKVARADPDRATERGYTTTATSTVTVTPAAVDKTVARPTYPVGDTGRWTVNVTIPALVNFYDAAVIDRLPAGIDPSTVTLTSSSCSPGCTIPGGASALTQAPGTPAGTTLVGWLLGDITSSPVARTIALTYTARVAVVPGNVAGTALTNEATLKWSTTDGTSPTSAGAVFGQQATPDTTTTTVTEPLLGIDKIVDDATPAPGQAFRYTVVVSNGTATTVSAAHDVTVVDTVPSGVVVDADSISNGGVLTGAGAGGGGTISWTLAGPIANGGSVSIGYDATLSDPVNPSARLNTADITEYHSLADEGGRQYDGPSDTATVAAALPHVSIDKAVVGSGIAYINEPTSWQITVTSDGDSQAYGVDVSDVLPANWSYVTGSTSVTVNGSPLADDEPAVSGRTLTWTDLGNLPVGTAIVISFSAIPGDGVVSDPGVSASVQHVNTASTTAEDANGSSGPIGGGSYAGPPDTATVVVHSADLAIDKSHQGDPVAGQTFSWTITVDNLGPDPAVGPFTVSDTLPAQVSGASASGPGWSCTVDDRDLTCTRPAGTPVAVNAGLPDITVNAAVPANLEGGVTLTNVADVDGRTYDPDPSNNEDTDTADVVSRADLAIDKEVSGAVVAGSEATWTISVNNLGPSVSRGPIVVTDDLPAGSTFVSATGDGWTCPAPVGGVLTCTLAADLPLGPAPSIAVVATVPSGQSGPVVNSAEIASTTTFDPNPDNDDDATSTAPDTSADLALAKQATAPVVAGQNATYRLTVLNNGPSDAVGVSIEDTLPAGVSYVGFTSVTGSWSCSAAGQTVTCDLAGTFADEGRAVVDLDVVVAPSVTGAIVNTATVDADTPDPLEANNTDDADSSVGVDSDMSIAKTHAGEVVAGESVTYTVIVTNEGPSDTPGPIVVTDAVPTGLTPVSAGGTGWVCEIDEQIVTCTRAAGLGDGLLAPAISIGADVAADAGPTTLTNLATVDGPADNNPANDTAEDPTEIVDRADVSIVKTATDPTPLAGSTTVFALEVSNAGPSDADDVTVSDTVPSGLSVVSAAGEGWTCDTTTASLSCSRPSLAADSSAPTITVTVRIDSGLGDDTVLTNVAAVATGTQDDNPGNDTDDAVLTLDTATDVSIVKTHEGAAVPGLTFDYVLAVSNAGPSDVSGDIVVTDELPDGLSFVAASGGDWSCEAGPPVTCTLPSPLTAEANAPELRITVLVDPSAQGEITNVAGLTPPADDTDPGNDADSDAVEVQPEADLSIVKTHSGQAVVGQPLKFTLAVSNEGPSLARQVTVLDPLPAGLVFESGAGEGWTCEPAAGDVRCLLAEPLAPGEDAPLLTITVTVGPAAYPSVTNAASVSSTATDPTAQDNTDTDTVTVPPLTNLVLTKQHQGEFVVGGEGRYVLTVRNAGPTPDPGPITVSDQLPNGLTLVGAEGAGWSCSGTTAVTCLRSGALAVGAESAVTLRVVVAAAAYPTATNVATVDSPADETSTIDNTAQDVVSIVADVELVVDKRVRSFEDGRVTYDITVTNQGPSTTVEPVVVVDDLPKQLELVSATGQGWTCPDQSGVVTCSHPGSLGVGDDASFTVVADVRARVDERTKIKNTARVEAGDTQGADPTDSVTITVPTADEDPDGDPDGDPDDPDNPAANAGDGDDGHQGELPRTGGPEAWLWALASLLVLAGGVLMRTSRRRT